MPICFDDLTRETNYAVHLIFQTNSKSRGLAKLQKAEIYVGSDKFVKDICIEPGGSNYDKEIGLPVERSDGWKELELWRFRCNDGTAGDEQMMVSVVTDSAHIKMNGLIIVGMEVRPC